MGFQERAHPFCAVCARDCSSVLSREFANFLPHAVRAYLAASTPVRHALGQMLGQRTIRGRGMALMPRRALHDSRKAAGESGIRGLHVPADRRRRVVRHRGAAGARKRGGPRYSIRMLGTGQTLRSHRGNDAGCLVIHSKSATADIPSQASLRTILTMMRPRERPQECSSIWREISRTDCHQTPAGK